MYDNEYSNGFVKIVDNFLPESTYKRISTQIKGHNFPWYWTERDYNIDDPTTGPDLQKSLKEAEDEGIKRGTFMWTHVAYAQSTNRVEQSEAWRGFEFIGDVIKDYGLPVVGDPREFILKIKLNCYPNRGEKYELYKHTDFYDDLSPEFRFSDMADKPKSFEDAAAGKRKPFNWITGVLFFDNCNGPTYVEKDGDITVCESVENRIIFFDGKLKHWAETQTDTDRRIVLNIYLRWDKKDEDI